MVWKSVLQRHGIISGVAWGLLLPVGTMAARYLRPLSSSNPAWFYIHVACQCSGYLLGVVAWAMGLQLHEYIVDEGTAVPSKHRNIGITIFTFASLQVLTVGSNNAEISFFLSIFLSV